MPSVSLLHASLSGCPFPQTRVLFTCGQPPQLSSALASARRGWVRPASPRPAILVCFYLSWRPPSWRLVASRPPPSPPSAPTWSDSWPSPPAAVLASLHPPDLGRRHPGCLSDLQSLPFRPIFPVARVLFLKCRPGQGSPWNNAACKTQMALLGQPIKLWMTRPPTCPLPIRAPPAGR